MVKEGQRLPDEHHVLRRAPWARFIRDGDGSVIRFFPEALVLRDHEEDLSVSWVEYHDGTAHERRVAQHVRELRQASARINKAIGPKTGVGIAKVLKVMGVCGGLARHARIVYTTSSIGSRSSIKELPRDDMGFLRPWPLRPLRKGSRIMKGPPQVAMTAALARQ